MSDLISKASVKDRASEYALSQDEYKRFCKIIDDEPIDYDLDKVVGALEKLQDKALRVNNYDISFYATGMMQKTIEIVKQGGVGTNDDVCEWKFTKEIMNNAEFKVGCNPNALKRGIVPNNFSYHDFKYCPYCGKKIKVVEQ